MIDKVTAPAQGQPQQQFDGGEQAMKAATGAVTGVSLTPVATITCPLCAAAFAPAPEHDYLLRANAKEFEAAFMSVCHFCFRCRRAACPECWDPVHRVCAQCVAEAGLPSRAEPPLRRVSLKPVVPAMTNAHEEVTASPFVCVRHGRYHPVPDPETDHSQQLVTVSSGQMPALQFPIAENKPDSQVSVSVLPVQSVSASDAIQKPAQVVEQQAQKPRGRILKTIERVLTIVLLLALLVVAALVVLAEASLPANAVIMRLLHVDIRAEVAYLIALVKQMHW